MYGKWTGNAVKCRKWIIAVVMVVVTDLEEKYGFVEMSVFFVKIILSLHMYVNIKYYFDCLLFKKKWMPDIVKE